MRRGRSRLGEPVGRAVSRGVSVRRKRRSARRVCRRAGSRGAEARARSSESVPAWSARWANEKRHPPVGAYSGPRRAALSDAARPATACTSAPGSTGEAASTTCATAAPNTCCATRRRARQGRRARRADASVVAAQRVRHRSQGRAVEPDGGMAQRRRAQPRAAVRARGDSAGPSAGIHCDEIRLGTEHEVADVQNLATLIVDPDGKGLETHWQKTAQALLVGVILHVLYRRQARGNAGDAGRGRRVAGGSDAPCRRAVEGDDAFPHLDGGVPSGGRQRRLATCSIGRTKKPGRCCRRRSRIWRSTAIRSSRRTRARPTFGCAISCTRTRPVTLYLVTQPTDKDRLRPLVRALVNMTLRLLADRLEFENGQPKAHYKHRLLLMLDEFVAMRRLPILQESLAFIAGYGIKAYLICQDIEQLKSARGLRSRRNDHEQLPRAGRVSAEQARDGRTPLAAHRTDDRRAGAGDDQRRCREPVFESVANHAVGAASAADGGRVLASAGAGQGRATGRSSSRATCSCSSRAFPRSTASSRCTSPIRSSRSARRLLRRGARREAGCCRDRARMADRARVALLAGRSGTPAEHERERAARLVLALVAARRCAARTWPCVHRGRRSSSWRGSAGISCAADARAAMRSSSRCSPRAPETACASMRVACASVVAGGRARRRERSTRRGGRCRSAPELDATLSAAFRARDVAGLRARLRRPVLRAAFALSHRRHRRSADHLVNEAITPRRNR